MDGGDSLEDGMDGRGREMLHDFKVMNSATTLKSCDLFLMIYVRGFLNDIFNTYLVI